MKIKDNWTIKDVVSGLSIKAVSGKKLNRLHIERISDFAKCGNRDFFFTKDGEFDGTGSSLYIPICTEKPKLKKPKKKKRKK